MTKRTTHSRSCTSPRPAPIAVAVIALVHGLASAQTLPAANAAPLPDGRGLFEQPATDLGSARPFSNLLDRLSSPVAKIVLRAGGDNLPADGLSGTDVDVQLLDREGNRLRVPVDVTIEVSAGARVLLPGAANPQTGSDVGDLNRIEPGVQAQVVNGELRFKLIAPFRPDTVLVRVSVRGVAETVSVRYVPELRELIAIGLIEGQLRADKFDPSQILPVREDDSFDRELRNFSKEFNGGSTRLGLRGAMYLKGKVRGDYLLTLAYDSEKDTRKRLFDEIDPNTFYPVYGDASVRGVDAQSSSKLYVRLDKGRSWIMHGDFTTGDNNPARSLSQYSRSLPGLRAHYEEGAVTANAFVARQSLAQVVDEFPARGVSGPYGVSRSNGVVGSEKIEILVRDRNQPTVILRVVQLTRSLDYEFEPFSGQILFRAPVPSVDDQLNPVSIRVTYEVDQGGEKFVVAGGDLALKLSNTLTVGVVAIKDENPAAPFTLLGANLHLKLSKTTELVAEVARADSVAGSTAGNFTVNNSANFRGVTGPVSGNAARVELRHSGEQARGRVYALRTDDGFNNSSGGAVGGRTEVGASGSYQVNKTVSINAEALQSEDRIAGTSSKAGSVGVDLKLSERLTVGAGVRHAAQSAGTLVPLIGSDCSLTGSTSSIATNQGYNVGFGINQVGNQQIDPATGRPVVCNTVTLPPTTGAGAQPLDASSVYLRGQWKATDKVTLLGELQHEVGSSNQTLYRVGADWQVAPKTRVYGRYELTNQFTGAYGLGLGDRASNFALGIDTQYMQDGGLYSEYRLRDASAGREVQSAVGLRNGWRVADGLRLVTNVERLKSTSGDATAAGVGLEYTASELWKGSGRLEWREDASNTNYLATVGIARKMDRNWTLLARDYFNLVQPKAGTGDKRQNRFQVGAAWRPVDSNRFDALALYERKSERDDSVLTDTQTDIISIRANYHPSRPWWLSARYAFKRVDELLLGTIRDDYHAQLFGARLTYDVTNRWSVGALATVLVGKGGARQYAYGLEVGYVVVDNLYVTLGYNFRGFSDDDLAGSNYTNRGWVLGLRYKFDEDLFKSSQPSVNKTLDPTPSAAPAAPATNR